VRGENFVIQGRFDLYAGITPPRRGSALRPRGY